MDFDDLDAVEVAAGPNLIELREALRAKQVPEQMAGATVHPEPNGKGFGGGHKQLQKVLFLHGPGSTESLCERQIQVVVKNLPFVVDYNIFVWDYWLGSIVNAVHEIHADPAVQEVFKPYGPDFFSYIVQANLNRQDEFWEPLDEVLDGLSQKLAASGPYDGLCGFDMGGGLALSAARLAQEGDKRFAGKFRYLMLFSTHGHKELSQKGQGHLRPKAPLQIPTFLGWSQEDDGRPYPAYEELCLYIHPQYRGVIIHDQGHRPPNIQKNTPACAALNRFVEDMQAGVRYKRDHCSASALYQDFFLPLAREPPAQPLPSGAKRLLIVVQDPLGENGPTSEDAADRLRFPAQEPPSNCALRLGILRAARGVTAADFVDAAGGKQVQVKEVTYSDEHKKVLWLPSVARRDVSTAYAQGAGRSRWVMREDEVVVPWSELRIIAGQLLESLGSIAELLESHVSIVGIGVGAHVAFALAEALIDSKNLQPRGFWAVCPPTIWPFEDAPRMGALVATPIRYLIAPSAVCGPPWRLETATFGPFSHGAFETNSELVNMVLQEVLDS